MDRDEPGCQGVTGDELNIIGQCTFYVKFDILKKAKKMKALVCSDDGCEILIDLQSLIDWTILPPNFPCPMDPREAEKNSVRWTKEKPTKLVDIKEKVGSQRTNLKFKDASDEDLETERLLHNMRERLIKKYSDVFKSDLGPEERKNMEHYKVETIEDMERFKVHNAFTPIETLRFLPKAANEDLSKMIKAGFLEPVEKATTWCSRGFFVSKPGSNNLKARLVSDFRNLNRVLRRPGYSWMDQV